MMIRMNEALRDRLRTLADEIVVLPALELKLTGAYAVAAPLVRRAVEARYPAKDMKVCAKYEAAAADDCIKLQLSAGGVEQFNFDKGTGPLVVKKTYQGTVYLADAGTTDAVLNWVAARDERNEATKATRADYYALIKGARTLEEVTEIWPEADAVSQYARSQALTVLSQDVLRRIRDDVASRTPGQPGTHQGRG